MNSKLLIAFVFPMLLSLPTLASQNNPGNFPEYFCGSLAHERYLGSPASLSGNMAVLRECALRFVLAEATLDYGDGIRKAKFISGPSADSSESGYVFRVRFKNGKIRSYFVDLTADGSHPAPDGNRAIIISPSPLGVCEGTTADSCG